ncbi:MAG: hypothetical protein ABSG15_02005, partial [FCB group bacterium]
ELFFFMSEANGEANKALLSRITSSCNVLTLDRYNVEMSDEAESFIHTVVDCFESWELYKDNYSKVDENGVERHYQECGFQFVYDKYIVETLELGEG